MTTGGTTPSTTAAGSTPRLSDRLAGVMLRTIGRSSDCVRLGFARGFDSGEMMDAIYRDRPSGRWGVGRLVDRLYLDQPGCRGLRGRKALLLAVVAELVAQQRRDGRRPIILDVAAGPGAYLVDLLARDRGEDLVVLARDRDPHALLRGRDLAERAGVTDRVRYDLGDALDRAVLVALEPRPTIAIASGFYELQLDETVIARSMDILRAALTPGGAFVFTTQVAHPQVSMMAMAPARDGRPWIAGNRPVAVVERLASDAGFRVVGSELEPTGIFAVSVAA